MVLTYTLGTKQGREEKIYVPGVGSYHRREESIYLEWEPIIGGKRVHTRSGNQSQEGKEHIPWSGNQAQEGREYIPEVGTNHRRGESLYLKWGPIT